MGGWALLGVSEPASAQTSHSASHSTPLHTLPNPSLFMTITTGLLSSNTCVCMQSLDFGAQHTQVVWTCSSKQSQWEGPYCSCGLSINEVSGVSTNLFERVGFLLTPPAPEYSQCAVALRQPVGGERKARM